MADRAQTWILGLESAAEWVPRLEEVLAATPRLEVHRGVIAANGGRPFELQLEPLLNGGDPRLFVLAADGEQSADALELLRALRARPARPPVLVAIDGGRPEQISRLLEAGATDFITPPLDGAQVLPRVRRILDRAAAPPAAKRKRELREAIGLQQILGENPAFRAEIDKIPRIARCDVPVLVCGETGTGKDLVARAIHYLSPRAPRPFVAVNCGAVPLELFENELFGHGRAAFTGATTAAPGLIHEAEGGTLFLDEIDSMPPAAQVKLLRFLEERRYRRLGSTRLREADVRVLAATNVDPEKAVAQGQLRGDLYYRLNVIRLTLPPLRRRQEDVPLLAEHFLAESARRFDRQLTGLSPDSLQRLLLHRWPGNVRELEHTIERAVVLSDHGGLLRPADLDLPSPEGSSRPTSFREAKARVIARFERNYLRRMLRAYEGNITRAARAARKDRKSFWELVRKHRIDARRFKH